MNELVEAKELLLLVIDGTADWRRQRAAEHPDDKRNKVCADALQWVADMLATYPVDHPLFKTLSEVNRVSMQGWSEIENQFLSRWGFFNESSRTDLTFRFVEELRKVADDYLADSAQVRKDP